MSPKLPLERRRIKSFPIQLKYAVMMTLVAGASSLLTIFVMAWFIQRNYNLLVGDELGISAQVIEVVRREQQLLETSLFVLFLFSVTTAFFSAFWVTRKLTGPVVALQRHLWLFTRGDWSKDFRLRKNDEFRELEQLMNQLRETHVNGVSPSDALPWKAQGY